jgi:hypothetical protein
MLPNNNPTNCVECKTRDLATGQATELTTQGQGGLPRSYVPCVGASVRTTVLGTQAQDTMLIIADQVALLVMDDEGRRNCSL